MILALLLNVLIVLNENSPFICELILLAQLLFYGMSLMGWLMEARQIKVKMFFIPYYFAMMNYAVIRGIFRFAAGKQSAVWEKAKRK